VLHKLITSEFITTDCIDFFVIAITSITTTLVVIATTFFVVLCLFSCSELWFSYIYIYIYICPWIQKWLLPYPSKL